APDVSSALDKLKEFGNTLEDKAWEVINRIKQSEFPAKT
nr:Chain A, CHOLESTERYL ESTER TRANSFERASE INHIBITOR PROTEIN [synthetic construct]